MKKVSYRRSILGAAVAVGMFGATHNAAAVTIDLFGSPDYGPVVFSSTSGPDPVSGGIGNFRQISGTASGANVQLGIANGKYSHSQSSGITGTSRIVWAGTTPPGTGFAPTDFTDGDTSNAVRVHVNDTDPAKVGNYIRVTLTSQGGASASQTYTLTGATPAVFYIDFLLSGFSGVDTTKVTKVQLDLNGQQSNDWDVDIDSIVTACSGNTSSGPSGPAGGPPSAGVCEPPPPPPPPEVEHPRTVPVLSSLGLFGLGAGLLGIGGFFARRKKK